MPSIRGGWSGEGPEEMPGGPTWIRWWRETHGHLGKELLSPRAGKAGVRRVTGVLKTSQGS